MAGNEREFLERIKNEKWPIYSRTTNRNRIKKGDRILFYLAGPHRKKIIASSHLGSQIRKEGDDFAVALEKIDAWKKHVPIQPLVGTLEFIKNKEKWGTHMQGGVVYISDKDHDLIVGSRKKL